MSGNHFGEENKTGRIFKSEIKEYYERSGHWFTCCYPVFPTPLAEEIVFFPFYVLASFVKE